MRNFLQLCSGRLRLSCKPLLLCTLTKFVFNSALRLVTVEPDSSVAEPAKPSKPQNAITSCRPRSQPEFIRFAAHLVLALRKVLPLEEDFFQEDLQRTCNVIINM